MQWWYNFACIQEIRSTDILLKFWSLLFYAEIIPSLLLKQDIVYLAYYMLFFWYLNNSLNSASTAPLYPNLHI